MGNEEVDLVTVAKPQEKSSLLRKYDVPVEHLSYEYLNRCSSAKEVERIVLILRSGEEGIFPELIEHGEKCLAKLNPKSKVLRVEAPVITRAMLQPEDRKLIDNDMTEWMTEMQGREKDLEEGKALAPTLGIKQPEIRQSPEVTVKRTSESRSKNVKPKSIASCDYSGWDKFDADAELDRMDIRDEQKQVVAKNEQKENRDKWEEAKNISRESMVNKLTLTATELSVLGEQEKNIGNEAYRAGDYEEALIRYNSSIGINSTVNAYNNRSITNIKLRRYQDAVNDCNVVLSMEHDNVTALMRRGLALEKLEKLSEALIDYQTILQLEPNNKIAINALNKLRKPSDSKKVRMKIEEEEDEKNSENETSEDFRKNGTSEICFCDRAPGFSRSPKPPPHYKSSYCLPIERFEKGKILLGQSRSQNSYFSDVKINSSFEPRRCGDYYESSKLIIEELPSAVESSISSNCKPLVISVDKNDKKCGLEKPEIPQIDGKSEMIKNDEKLEKIEELKNGKIDFESIKKNFPVSKQQKKISVASKYEKHTLISIADEKSDTIFSPVESPYEFFHTWQSLKNDIDFSLRGKLLRSLAPEDLNAVIGNKLDGNMFSVILRCLESHFRFPEDSGLINRFMIGLAKLSRFSIVRLFMDSEDKRILGKILSLLEPEISSDDAAKLREAYDLL